MLRIVNGHSLIVDGWKSLRNCSQGGCCLAGRRVGARGLQEWAAQSCWNSRLSPAEGASRVALDRLCPPLPAFARHCPPSGGRGAIFGSERGSVTRSGFANPGAFGLACLLLEDPTCCGSQTRAPQIMALPFNSAIASPWTNQPCKRIRPNLNSPFPPPLLKSAHSPPMDRWHAKVIAIHAANPGNGDGDPQA
jgi:hypothetical protein